MPRTLGQLLSDVRNRLDEQSARMWGSPELRGWILEGARDVARRAEILLQSSTIAVTSGTQQYTGPTDAVRIYRVEWQPTGQSTIYPLEYYDFASMDELWGPNQIITQAYPIAYTMWGFPPSLKIILYPSPSSNGQLNVYYYRLPADLATDGSADNTNVDVPEGWWDLIPKYCEFVAMRKDGDQRWQDARALYEAQLDGLIEHSRRWTDQAGSFSFADRMIPAWLYGTDM